METIKKLKKDISVGDLVRLRTRKKTDRKSIAIVLELIDPDDFKRKEENTIWLNYAYKVHSKGKILYISSGQIECVLSSGAP